MAYTSLYRRFRPQSFDTMIGQQHIKQTLKNAILSQNIAHAYLFTGTRGTGKTSAAKIFAKAINCLNPNEDGSPCNECENCKQLGNNNNLDIIELDAASNNSVDDIRQIIDKVSFAPSFGKYKVYIIDEAHMLTKQAWNAFLKTLEEPPEHAVFIMATTEVYKIPDTILSRCIRFDFRLLSKEELSNHIIKVFKEVGIDYDKEAVLAIADAGNGSVRDCLSIADMVISYCGNKKIEYKDVLEVLGASSPEIVVTLADYILSNKTSEALTLASKTLDMGKSVEVLATDLAEMFKNVLYAKNCMDAKNILGLPTELYSKIKDISISCTNTRIYNAIEIFTNVQNSLKFTTLGRVILEMSIAKACDISTDITIDGVQKRLKDLEAFKRTFQGVNSPAGTLLTATQVWGGLLNNLKAANKTTEYTFAARVSMKNLDLKDLNLIVTIDSEPLYNELVKYTDLYLRIINSQYSEIQSVQFNLKKDEKQETISNMQNMFGDGFRLV